MSEKKHILLLHGALGTKDQMAPLAAFLESEFSVHTFDFTGHGKRSGFQGNLDFDLFVKDIREYMDTEGFDKADFFGYSMGGYAALCFAHQFPDRSGKICTLGTKFIWDEESTNRELKMLNAEKIKAKVPKFAAMLARQHGAYQWESLLEQTAAMMKQLSYQAPLSDEVLSSLVNPITLAVGDQDTTAGVKDTAATFFNLSDGKIVELPDTPHPIERVSLDQIVGLII